VDAGLKDKTVLVTGAAGGIGSETCRAFLREGAKVVLHYRSQEKEAKAIAALAPERTLALRADLTSESEVEKLFNDAEKLLAPVDILIANAGIWEEKPAPIHKMTLKQWNHTLATNLTSLFLCFRRFFQGIEKHQLTHPAGVIIGSTAGIFGEALHADYAASKSGATAGLLLSLKNEIVHLATQGRVNAICPGWVKTPMAGDLESKQDEIRRVLQTVALRKIGLPEDIAAAAVFLSSSLLAGHMTGQTLVLSGGMEGRVLFEKTETSL